MPDRDEVIVKAVRGVAARGALQGDPRQVMCEGVVHPTTDRGCTFTSGGGALGAQVPDSSGICCHYDYLSLTGFDVLPETGLELVGLHLLEFVPGDERLDALFVDVGRGRGYGRVLVASELGISFYRDPQHGCHWHLELKGRAWEWLTIERVQRFLRAVVDQGGRWHATRVDVAWDGAEFGVAEVYRAVKRGDVRSTVRRVPGWWKFIESGKGEEVGADDDDDREGNTVYLGSRRGERQLVAYDKRGFTRLEFRAKHERADLIFRDLLRFSGSGFSARARGHVLDFASFVRRDADACVSRCPELSWWKRFLDGALRAGLRVVRQVCADLHGHHRRVERAVRSASLIAAIHGIPFFVDQVKQCVECLDDSARSTIAAVKLALEQDQEGAWVPEFPWSLRSRLWEFMRGRRGEVAPF